MSSLSPALKVELEEKAVKLMPWQSCTLKVEEEFNERAMKPDPPPPRSCSLMVNNSESEASKMIAQNQVVYMCVCVHVYTYAVQYLSWLKLSK